MNLKLLNTHECLVWGVLQALNIMLHTIYVGSGFMDPEIPVDYVASLATGFLFYFVVPLLVSGFWASWRGRAQRDVMSRWLHYNLSLQFLFFILHVYQLIMESYMI